MTEFETVIGVEIHAQLKTKTKLFSDAPVLNENATGTSLPSQPNYWVNEVCLGLPGTLPVPNEHAVRLAVRAGLMLGCQIRPISRWSRKQYFYPDLPKGYQMTQFDEPYAEHGQLTLRGTEQERSIRIRRIHMEEDAGKSLHHASGKTLLDYNRAGTALIEIVTEPDFRFASEVAEFMRLVRSALRSAGICDGDLERGNFRCDANVSVRAKGSKMLGTRTELKNINSFRFIQAAIDYEANRQIKLVTKGESVQQQTRLWDQEKKCTRSMRGKEDAHDYRYFPEPDLPALCISEAWIEEESAHVPESPWQRRDRYVDTMSLKLHDVATLIEDHQIADFFEQAISSSQAAPQTVVNLLLNEVLGQVDADGISGAGLTPIALGRLGELLDGREISSKIAKRVLQHLIEHGGDPDPYIEEHQLKSVSDEGELEKIVIEVLQQHPEQAQQFRAGNEKVVGFLMGQVMRISQGKADPQLAQSMLRAKLQK